MNRTPITLLFTAVLLGAGVAKAQVWDPPVDPSTQTGVPGVTSGGTPVAANEGDFRTYAYITTSLDFDVTDSTIECGQVSASGTGAACTDTATMTVHSNAPWLITRDDEAGAGANTAWLTNDDPARPGDFQFTLAADGGAGRPDVTVSQLPGPNVAVTITANWTATSSLNSVTSVDPSDEYGTYQGSFTVILAEQ